MDSQLMIIRHGFSTWNEKNLFTGWQDVQLTDSGVDEAKRAAQVIKQNGFIPDVVYTSVLDRAIKTNDLLLEGLNLNNVEVHQTWLLNERHYGALTGLNKVETVEKYGEEQVLKWRRSFDIPPPPVEEGSEYDFRKDPLYSDIPNELIPLSECLKDVCDRVQPFYVETIVPRLLKGQNVLIVAHGNSLRSLIKDLESLSSDEIVNFELPTATPRKYTFNDDLTVKNASFIEADSEVQARAAKVKAQTSK